MTVNELYRELSTKIPEGLSCDWDNDGLMCCPDGERQVGKVLIALDVTSDVVSFAVSGGFDLIVSHHPFIFKGLKSVNEENYIAAKAIELIKNNISVMSFHTRLDAVSGGVNDVLSACLGLENVTIMANGNEEIGRVGELPEPLSLSDFAERVKKTLGAPAVVVSDAGLPVHRVAVLGGEGGDDIYAARASGADTFVSGRLGYHNMVDAPEMGINLIEAGHFYTENPVCGALVGLIRDIDGNIKTEIYCSNRIKIV